LQTRFNNKFLFLNLVISGLDKGIEIIFLIFLPFLKEDLKQQRPQGAISIAYKFTYMLLNLFLLDNFVVKRTSTYQTPQNHHHTQGQKPSSQ